MQPSKVRRTNIHEYKEAGLSPVLTVALAEKGHAGKARCNGDALALIWTSCLQA